MHRFCLFLHRCFPHTDECPICVLRYTFHAGASTLLVNTKVEQSEPVHDPLAPQSTGSSAQCYIWRDTLSEPKRCSLLRCEIHSPTFFHIIGTAHLNWNPFLISCGGITIFEGVVDKVHAHRRLCATALFSSLTSIT